MIVSLTSLCNDLEELIYCRRSPVTSLLVSEPGWILWSETVSCHLCKDVWRHYMKQQSLYLWYDMRVKHQILLRCYINININILHPCRSSATVPSESRPGATWCR